MQEVGDHEPVSLQLGAAPPRHLDVADDDSMRLRGNISVQLPGNISMRPCDITVRLLGHFTVSSLPGHGTHAVAIVGRDGHECQQVSSWAGEQLGR